MFVEANNRKHVHEDFLKTLLQALLRRRVQLKERSVRVELNPDEVRDLKHFFQFSKVQSVRHNPPCSYVEEGKNITAEPSAVQSALPVADLNEERTGGFP